MLALTSSNNDNCLLRFSAISIIDDLSVVTAANICQDFVFLEYELKIDTISVSSESEWFTGDTPN